MTQSFRLAALCAAVLAIGLVLGAVGMRTLAADERPVVVWKGQLQETVERGALGPRTAYYQAIRYRLGSDTHEIVFRDGLKTNGDRFCFDHAEVGAELPVSCQSVMR